MLTVHETLKLSKKNGCLLVDIRAASDQVDGVAVGAQCMSPDKLLASADKLMLKHEQIVVMCYKGISSQQLCAQLGKQFVSMQGGFDLWQQEGLPIELPHIDDQTIRYQQQIKLSGFGEVAQKKLSQSHVMVVGAGGLGSPALLYLAASGVGEITLIDDDEVSLSNLHRQILFSEHDIGSKKVASAAERLSALNSQITINKVLGRLAESNVSELLDKVDLVVDGSDNVKTRYLINDQCNKARKPWVFAAVTGFEIQVAVFVPEANELCYRCLFPNISDNDAANCAQEGVLGTVPGIAGLIQATEAIKYLTGLGGNLRQKMLTYNVLNHQFKVLKYPSKQQCQHR